MINQPSIYPKTYNKIFLLVRSKIFTFDNIFVQKSAIFFRKTFRVCEIDVINLYFYIKDFVSFLASKVIFTNFCKQGL